ncbi:MAG: hypothetical protein GXO86_02155 [Chlorobi bacterium]|nr:hypothetical protein [Chlorobiota bacterium]
MTTDSLQNIWKNIDSGIEQKPKKELESILEKKIKKTMNKFYVSLGISMTISIGFLIFLIMAAIRKPDDILYQINNYLLSVLVLFALGSSIWSWYKLQYNKNNLPLKEWLELRIKWLSKWLYNKWVYFLLPVLFILTFFSLHFYNPYLSFTEVTENPESLIGILVGILVGGVVVFFVFRANRRSHRRKLEYLKELLEELCEKS